MKQALSKLFLKESSKWHFWLFLSFLAKGLIFIFLISRHGVSPLHGFSGTIAGDTYTYFEPIENLISHGTYSPDFRMPGYGVLYLPLAFFFSKSVAFTMLIVLQYIVAASTIYPLSLIARYLFKSTQVFYLTFYLYLVSTYTSLFDATLLTESFTTSFLILSVFFLVKAFETEKRHSLNLIISGLFITWVVFLRPVFMPLVLLYLTVVITFFYLHELKKSTLAKSFLFLLPFIIFEGTWISRNYITHRKFIPATATIYYPGYEDSYYPPLLTLARSWGGSDQYWDPDAEIRWFGLNDGLQPQLHNIPVAIPNYVYTSKFNYDSLLILKKQLGSYISLENIHSTDTIKMSALLTGIRVRCHSYAASIKNEKPFLYYIKAPLMRTKHFLLHSGTYNLFTTLTSQLNSLCYGIKVFYSLLYIAILTLGTFGIILLTRKNLLSTPVVIITAIVCYTILVHPILLGKCEKRYFVPAYPFILICAADLLSKIKKIFIS